MALLPISEWPMHKRYRNCVSMGHKYQMSRPSVVCFASYLPLWLFKCVFLLLKQVSALLAQIIEAQPICQGRLVFLPLFPDSTVVLQKCYSASVIFDQKSFISKFGLVCVLGYTYKPNCQSVHADCFLYLIAHITGVLTPVICFSSTSVMAQRKHKANPTGEKGGGEGSARWWFYYQKRKESPYVNKLKARNSVGFN